MARGTPLFADQVKLLAGVLTLHLFYAGFHIVSRAAIDMGMGKIVFMVYRNVIAVTLLAPLAYFLEKSARPPMSFSLAMNFFAVALVMTMSQGFYILGVYYLSPTYVSAIQNSIPAITFALAAALRLEQINITKIHGVAKLVGTLTSIGGATVITLYKGTPLLRGIHSTPFLTSEIHNWKLGCLFLIAHCLSWSSWIVLQVPLLKRYPAGLSVSTITSFIALFQFLVITAFTERTADLWKIRSAGMVLCTLYAGIVWSGIGFTLQIWCIGRGGPLYVAVFQPLQTVAVAVIATCMLGDHLYTGGIIGAGIIMVGLYTVIWGKSKETVPANEEQLEASHLAKPLIAEDDDRQRQNGGSFA